jgi:hypothetical protein
MTREQERQAQLKALAEYLARLKWKWSYGGCVMVDRPVHGRRVKR